MPNDPLIEEYVERFNEESKKFVEGWDKFDSVVRENGGQTGAIKFNCIVVGNFLETFLRTSLKEYGDKRVGEYREELKRSIEGRTNYCKICEVWLKDGEHCDCI